MTQHPNDEERCATAPYLTVFRIRILALLQYRASALAKLVPPLFVGWVQVEAFSAFFGGAAVEQPLTLAQTITYLWMVQLLVNIQPWSGDPEVIQTIRTGNLAYELCRPIDLYGLWFARLCASRAIPLLTASVPLGLAALCLLPDRYRMGPPPSAAALLAFLLALTGAILMSAALSNIMGIITVWTISGEGIYYLAPVIFMVLSGAVAPLPLFPPALQGLINFLPFRGLIDTPAQTYLGQIPPLETLRIVGVQLLWTTGFVAGGRLLLNRALKSVVIQGG